MLSTMFIRKISHYETWAAKSEIIEGVQRYIFDFTLSYIKKNCQKYNAEIIPLNYVL